MSKNGPCTDTVDGPDGSCGRCRCPQHDRRIAAHARSTPDDRNRNRLARLYAA